MRRKLPTKLANTPGARLGGFRSLPIPSRIALGFLLLIVTVAVFAPFLAKALENAVPCVLGGSVAEAVANAEGWTRTRVM